MHVHVRAHVRELRAENPRILPLNRVGLRKPFTRLRASFPLRCLSLSCGDNSTPWGWAHTGRTLHTMGARGRGATAGRAGAPCDSGPGLWRTDAFEHERQNSRPGPHRPAPPHRIVYRECTDGRDSHLRAAKTLTITTRCQRPVWARSLRGACPHNGSLNVFVV